MANDNIQGFVRDTQLRSMAADDFGGSAQNADGLIEAHALAFTPELEAANLLPFDGPGTDAFSAEEVAEAADLDISELRGFSKRGLYLVVLYTDPDGRVGKDILTIDPVTGALDDIDRPDTPQRAALKAQLEAATKVKNASVDAEKILEDARAEAAKILAEAAAKAQEDHTVEKSDAVAARVEGSGGSGDSEAATAVAAGSGGPVGGGTTDTMGTSGAGSQPGAAKPEAAKPEGAAKPKTGGASQPKAK